MARGPVPAVRAGRLARSFGDVDAVRGIDIEVLPGQVHALVGLNGAGKSTLLRLLVGLLRPGSGSAELFGVPAWGAPADVRARVGFVGSGHAYGELTVRENLRTAARLHGSCAREATARADALVESLALGRWAGRRVRTLSDGNRRRVELACALVHDADLLVLDEPTNALDPAGVVEIRESVLRRAAGGAAVLVSSHHLDEMARVATTIDVVHEGRVVGRLPPDGADLERQFFRTVHAAAEAGR
ncbi:ABC transporter ATP-binding protein [Cellulosimicrobium protaetiae]|uniref:ABC transporter ATP-binding protein n=1 Tax=Cellulosimicrobium protaetiae TaxID=2587808 RepID=A0A6M5UCA8_9MICO|nr:ABC transporter ATP-binding protein [Cellulosimicrobium protaetiae]QJW35001.1 ABC transporter ATP-binding protein [Cellulosimicrobium protaetiae]